MVLILSVQVVLLRYRSFRIFGEIKKESQVHLDVITAAGCTSLVAPARWLVPFIATRTRVHLLRRLLEGTLTNHEYGSIDCDM